MPLIENESVILKSYDLADADRIVVFLTRHHGVIRGVAKGIKRLNSRFGSSFEPFNLANLTYFQKEDRELVSIQNAELLTSNFQMASDPSVLETYSYISDLVLAITPPSDPNELLFRMVRACFESDVTDPESLVSMRFYFESWLLKLGGYLPDWERCHQCKRVFEDTDRPAFDSAQHLICIGCHSGRLGEGLRSGWLAVLRATRKLGPSEFASDRSMTPIVAELSAATRKIIERVLDRPLKSTISTATELNG